MRAESSARATLRRGACALAGALSLVLATVAPSASAGARTPAAATGSWTTYGGTPTRTAYAASPPLLPLRVRWRTTGLDGAIYGEPLVYGGRVYVATESDVAYALDARTGRVLWARTLGRAVPAQSLPCGDIAPSVGVTSTMVLDPSLGRLFVSAATFSHGRVRHVLVGLSLTGRIAFERDLDRPGWDAAAQLQRAGLALDAGRVLVGFGGNYGDCGRYHGVLVAAPESGRGRILAYQVPTRSGGAIWAPGGVAVEPNGRILLATGNSTSTTVFDGGDGVLALSPTLRRVSWFAPEGFVTDNLEDLDLGSTAPVLLPGGRVFAIGKAGIAYLLDARRLGGLGGSIAARPVCYSAGASAFAAGRIIVACPQGALTALRLAGSHLLGSWQAPVAGTGSPTVASGVVWSIGGGTLYGFALGSGRAVAAVPVVGTEHFAAPAAGAGLLVVGGAGAVEAFGGPGSLPG